MNPITSFFAAPSQSSLPKPSSSSSPQATTSAPDLEPGQHHVEHCQTTEEMGPIPSSNDREEMAGFVSDGETFKPCSSLEPASCRNLFPSDDPDADVKCTPTFGSIGSPVPQRNFLQTLKSDGCNDTCTRSSDSRANPCEDLVPTLIQCSPVEDHVCIGEPCDIKSKVTFTFDSCEVEKEADEGLAKQSPTGVQQVRPCKKTSGCFFLRVFFKSSYV